MGLKIKVNTPSKIKLQKLKTKDPVKRLKEAKKKSKPKKIYT